MKAIPTKYKGYKFRSRLEARWAIFFDACGVKWEYEPEGFILSDGSCYLPDFRLYEVPYNFEGNTYIKDIWAEVKGDMSKKDMAKIKAFARAGNHIIVLENIPYADDVLDLDAHFANSKHTHVFPYVNKHGIFTLIAENTANREPYIDPDVTVELYRLARQARFEHGETPKARDIIELGRRIRNGN